MNLDQDSYFKTQKTKIRSEKGWVGFFFVCFCFILFFSPSLIFLLVMRAPVNLRVHMSYLWKSLVETFVADGNLGLYRPGK